ncbi:Cof-type HAD-IIB family hydrolase [Bacillus alkalicellulosilyticus]|uniref:Cof-type HAD-IIB family hydrolase n=1 Tax=Alkalihalobacterium alkalicellulosilyticum TaxID=1912214 RepID=UPI0009964322|nr:Cof-type HAD-IIB family hydrolase [Bacillus alkalicellulosilyticus]
MLKKIVFFDIDGTLYDEEKRIPDSTVSAISALKEEGIDVAIATGRAPFMFADLREKLGIDTYVSLNGSFVVYQDEVVFTKPLEAELLTKLEKEAKQLNHPIVYVHSDDHYANEENHPFIVESIGSLKIKKPEYNPKFSETSEVYQALLFCDGSNEDIYKVGHPHFDFIRWHPYSVDVIPGGGSKAKGIEVLLEKVGIPVENSYAFGDELNDLQMLQYVGTGVAMGNGRDEVKAVANYVTKTVTEDGILHGLKHVGLLKGK